MNIAYKHSTEYVDLLVNNTDEQKATKQHVTYHNKLDSN